MDNNEPSSPVRTPPGLPDGLAAQISDYLATWKREQIKPLSAAGSAEDSYRYRIELRMLGQAYALLDATYALLGQPAAPLAARGSFTPAAV